MEEEEVEEEEVEEEEVEEEEVEEEERKVEWAVKTSRMRQGTEGWRYSWEVRRGEKKEKNEGK